jgi:aminoglycoside 6'-N-acetyltransferase I
MLNAMPESSDVYTMGTSPSLAFRSIDPTDAPQIDALAQLTFDAFRTYAPSWLPSKRDAELRVLGATEGDRLNRVLIDKNNQPLGWIGVIPVNHGRIWEIHPLAISCKLQRRGYGRMLVAEVERLAQHRGVLGLLAGTSDETGATPLYQMDLYADPLKAMGMLTGTEDHPVAFWMRVGFKVVGVVPDADGRGRPGITLAKGVN